VFGYHLLNRRSREKGTMLMAADDQDSLLAHLAWKFPGQTETLATEALGYILLQSVAAREALREMLLRH